MTFFRSERFSTWIRSPLVWILIACGLIRVIGIGWGLPASDGWDNDGVAPRDFLAGLVETFTPGHYYTYPPFHLLVLGLLTLPITAVALFHAASFAPHDVVNEILNVSYMTSIAYVARATSLVMSLGITYAVAKIAETVRGERAGLCAAAVCGVDLSLTYYAHTTNLDVPYLFWSCFALLALVRAIAWNEPKRLRTFVILAVLAVATKDQAYALFLLGVPLSIGGWLLAGERTRQNASAILGALARATALGAPLFLVVDGIIWNPTGFRARLQFLVGPASQDYATYAATLEGRMLVLKEAARFYAHLWPSAFLVLTGGGLLLFLWSSRAGKSSKAATIAGLVPLFAAISFTLAFNCVARRVEHRFILPQSLMLAVYAGFAVEAFLFDLRGRLVRFIARAAIAAAFARALFLALAVDASLLLDPRYDAERWMREHFAPGDRVEVYGLNVYLPRFPPNVHIARIGPEPTARRNPMPGFEEVQARFEDVEQRKPRWIVMSQGWAWRYLMPMTPSEMKGEVIPSTQAVTRGNASALDFFQNLVDGRLRYRRAHDSNFDNSFWPELNITSSVQRPIWILERTQE